MKTAKAISVALGLLIVVPIWYYLLYQVLVRVHASELMFFLYWVYLPVGILVKFIDEAITKELRR